MPLHRFCRIFMPVLLTGGMGAVAWGQQGVGELYATDARVKGAVILAGSGTSIVSGSAIQAGAQAATLKLDRGGSLLVCPGTNLSIASSQNGRALLLSVSSGNLELDYPLGASADSLLTPDFRIVMPGPGRLHAAVRISPQGDTCVQTEPSNSTAITVYEAMGDDTYQVKDNEAVLFKGGHIKGVLPSNQPCGCPVPPARTQVAKATAPPASPTSPAPTPAPEKKMLAAELNKQAPTPIPDKGAPAPQSANKPSTLQPDNRASAAQPDKNAESAPLPITPSPDEHITMEAPFVFHGDDPYPDLTTNVASLKIENNQVIQLDPVVLPPKAKQPKPVAQQTKTASAAPEKKRGFFAGLGAFFASIFK